MSVLKKMYSKTFFIVNLVLLGAIVGFGAAVLPYSCDTGAISARETAQADSGATVPADSKAAVDQATQVQNAFRYVSALVLPSVVQIDVVSTKEGLSSQDMESPWKFFFGEPDSGDGAPQPYQERGLGSGIIVRKDKNTYYVLTNNHVAGNADEIDIILFDKREFKGKLVGADNRKDLALVSFETDAADIKVATMGDSNELRVGDWAIAVGSPLGMTSSVTAGIVSALNRSGGEIGNISDFIQTDAAINQGNSGGALVNIKGEVIGINTWIATPSGGSIGLGFAIPINNAKKAIGDFIKGGVVEYGWLGVRLGDSSKEEMKELGLASAKGAFIDNIYMDGPAAKGGLLPGDMIVKVNGGAIEDAEQLVRVVGDLPVGTVAKLQVLRNGNASKPMELSVTIEKRDEASTTTYAKLWPGIVAISVNNPDLKKGAVPDGAKGALIINVMPKSPAATMELKPGDLIVAVNEKKCANLLEFYRLLNDLSQKKIAFTVLRDGHEVTTLAYVRK